MYTMYDTGERSEPEKNYQNKIKTTFRPHLLPIKPPHKTPPPTNLRGGGGGGRTPGLPLWIRTCGSPLHTLSKLYDVPVGFVNPSILRLCVALFAGAEGWLLFDIGWFVLFLLIHTYSVCRVEPVVQVPRRV